MHLLTGYSLIISAFPQIPRSLFRFHNFGSHMRNLSQRKVWGGVAGELILCLNDVRRRVDEGEEVVHGKFLQKRMEKEVHVQNTAFVHLWIMGNSVDNLFQSPQIVSEILHQAFLYISTILYLKKSPTFFVVLLIAIHQQPEVFQYLS